MTGALEHRGDGGAARLVTADHRDHAARRQLLQPRPRLTGRQQPSAGDVPVAELERLANEAINPSGLAILVVVLVVVEDLVELVGGDAAAVVADVSGHIRHWNEAAAAATGWTAEEALGRNLVSYVIAADLIDLALIGCDGRDAELQLEEVRLISYGDRRNPKDPGDPASYPYVRWTAGGACRPRRDPALGRLEELGLARLRREAA